MIQNLLSGDNHFTETFLNDLINQAIIKLTANARYTERDVPFNSVLGQYEYNLGKNSLTVKTVTYDDGRPLVLIPHDTVLSRVSGYGTTQAAMTGTPDSFYIRMLSEDDSNIPVAGLDPSTSGVVKGQYVLGLVPTPSETGKVIKVTQAERAVKLTLDTESPAFPEEHHMAIVFYVLDLVNLMDHEPGQARIFEGKFIGTKMEMKQETAADQPKYIKRIMEDEYSE